MEQYGPHPNLRSNNSFESFTPVVQELDRQLNLQPVSQQQCVAIARSLGPEPLMCKHSESLFDTTIFKTRLDSRPSNTTAMTVY